LLYLVEENFLSYSSIYDQLTLKLIENDGYMPLMQHPILYDYIVSQSEFSCDFKQSFFSIRTEKDEIVAIFHGSFFYRIHTDIIEFSSHVMPSTFVENQNIIHDVSYNQYKNILQKIILDKNKVWYRDYCNYGKISLLGSLISANGGECQTNFTRIINIEPKEQIIKNNFRKSYKSLINQAEKKIKIKTLDYLNIVDKDIQRLSKFHQLIAKRQTRSLKSWKEQLNLVQNKKGFFMEAYLKDELLGFSFFLCFGKILFYGSSAFTHDSYGSSHLIIWNAIKYAKTQNCKLFDIGQQTYKGDKSGLDVKKLKSISLFKRGFGGSDQLYLDFKFDKIETQ